MKVSYVGQYETLPGLGGEGGRSDLVFDLADSDVACAGIHPWHLAGVFRWADDYYGDNHTIIPEESKSLFKGYKHYADEIESVTAP